MTQLFDEAVKRACALPEAEQDRIAQIHITVMEVCPGGHSSRDYPEEYTLLDYLADKAMADYFAGRTWPLP